MLDPARLFQLREKQNAATGEMMRNIRACLPLRWSAAILEVNVAYTPWTKTRAITHRLFNPATGEVISDFPEPLFQSVTALHVISTELNEPWIRAIVTIPEQKPGAHAYEISYVYGPA